MNRLKSLIAAVCCIFSIQVASAQAHYVSKVSIGGKAGITMSKMSFSPSTKQSFVLGKTAGVTFKYWEERNFGLIAEINYELRGW